MGDVRIWRYHAQPPRDERVARILRRAQRYYNQLIEIERDRLARYAAIRREHAPDLAQLEDDWAALDDRAAHLVRQIKRARQRRWQVSRRDKTLAVPDDMAAELERVQANKRRVSAAAKPLRKAFSERLQVDRERYKDETRRRANGAGPRIKSRVNADVLAEMLQDESTDPAWRAIAESDDAAQRAVRAARADCDLAPGTYLVVEEAVARATKDTRPRAPRFRAFRGEGKIAVQLRSVTFADVLAGTTMLRLVPNPKPGRKGKSEEHFVARIRIGSKGREPVWADFPVRLHRRPPDDASVKWAWVTIRKHGERMRYELQLVLQHKSFGEPKRPAGVGDGGHVRIGWGQTATGVRVATWPDGEMVVPTRILRRAEHADLLRSHADTHYDHVRRVLRLVTRTTGWELLRNERRRLDLRRVCTAAADHHLGDDLRPAWRAWVASRPHDLFPPLREADTWIRARGHSSTSARLSWWIYLWARKDKHLRQWSDDVRRSVERRRDAVFRETAIRLATQHATLTIDSYSIANLKQKPRPLTMPGESVNEVAQHNAQVAAPGRFREILCEVMGDRCTPCERPGGDGDPGTARKPRKRGRPRAADDTRSSSVVGGEVPP